MKVLRIYQGVIVALLCLVLVILNNSHTNYTELISVNDRYINLIDEQRNNYNSQYEMWKQSYEKLQTNYGELLVDNHKLESRLAEVEIPVYDYTLAEIDLLARCVEAEAGRGKEESQKYITQVILNRLHSSKFPSSIEEVIYHKVKGVPQFSVAYNGAIDEREVEPETLANVYSVLIHGTDLPEYVCYFYSSSVTENWVNTLNVHDTVQGTVFAYKDKEDY